MTDFYLFTFDILYDRAAVERLKKTSADIDCSLVSVPQVKPLSAGETLGCTAPLIKDADCLGMMDL